MTGGRRKLDRTAFMLRCPMLPVRIKGAWKVIWQQNSGEQKWRHLALFLFRVTIVFGSVREYVFYVFFRFQKNVTYVFTARCHASAVLAMGLCPSVSVCLSVTSRCSTKTAKRRITQTTPHDAPGTLVFWCQRSPRNSTGVTPYEDAECRWGGSKSTTFDIYPAISRKR